MIDYGLVEAYIRDVVEERVPRLRAKRRIVDPNLPEYTWAICEVEGSTMAPVWDIYDAASFKLICLENEDEYAVALWRDDAVTAFEGELGERRTLRFDNRERMLMYPGRLLPD
jgi:hypothetical protein